MLGIQRLHNRFTRLFASTRASGYLRQQLEGPLRRSEVGEPETDIRRNHPDERDARKVVPFRNHLRPDEDIQLVALSLVGLLERVIIEREEGELDISLDRLVDRCVVLYLTLLGAVARG